MTEREGMREQIARVVYEAWREPIYEDDFAFAKEHPDVLTAQLVKASFERADAILALLSPLLREAMKALEPFSTTSVVVLPDDSLCAPVSMTHCQRARAAHAKLEAMMEGAK